MTESQFPNAGEIFEGRYLIKQVIGAGGFSRVYLAQQTDLDRPVAIKILDPDIRGGRRSEEEIQLKLQLVAKRFEREAKLVSRLRDSHTVVMHDYGRTAGGQLFMVMEYVDGITISDLIHHDGMLAAKRVAKIMRQALLSLQEAHAFGVLHRDIKPQNIMVYNHVGRSDQVKVLDFGIAKTVSDSSTKSTSELTGDGVLIGTPRYMSPEQIRGDVELQPSSDLYSLGLVAYEMVMGERAISAESSMKIIARHLDPQPIRLPMNSAIPGGMQQIIDKMLHKSIRHRYQTCDEVLDDLEHYAMDRLPDPGIEERTAPEPLPAARSHELPLLLHQDSSNTDTVFLTADSTQAKPKTRGPSNATLALMVVFLATVLAGLLGYHLFFKDTKPSAAVVEETTSTPTIRAVEAALAAEEPEKLDEELDEKAEAATDTGKTVKAAPKEAKAKVAAPSAPAKFVRKSTEKVKKKRVKKAKKAIPEKAKVASPAEPKTKLKSSGLIPLE